MNPLMSKLLPSQLLKPGLGATATKLVATQQPAAAAASFCEVVSKGKASRDGSPVPIGPSYSDLNHSGVPMIAHMFRTVSVAEGACTGSVLYVQGSSDTGSTRMSLHDGKTCVISCKYTFNYSWWWCWSSSSPGNPTTCVPDHLFLPWGNKVPGFSIAALERARAVPREHKAGAGYQCQHECKPLIMASVRSEWPVKGRTKSLGEGACSETHS